MDGISDQSQGPRRQHSMISRSPAVLRASEEALGVGEQSQRSTVSSSKLAGPRYLQASGRSSLSAIIRQGPMCQPVNSRSTAHERDPINRFMSSASSHKVQGQRPKMSAHD